VSSRPFVSGLLLAAGTSSRFGGVKQLAELDGKALVERASKMLERSSVDEVVVVLGHAAPEVRNRLGDSRVRVVLNPEFKRGLSSSLKLGVRSLDGRSDAVVVCLADQPFVTSELVDRLIAKFSQTGADAIASVSGELVSPPVLLSRNLYGQVAELEGDKGAKAIVMGQEDFEKVEVEKETLLDIDTEAQLANARKMTPGEPSKAKGPARGAPSRGRPSSEKQSPRRREGSRHSE